MARIEKNLHCNKSSYKNINNIKSRIFDVGDHVKIVYENLNLDGIIFYIMNKNEYDCEYNILLNIKDINFVWCKKEYLISLKNKTEIKINNHDMNNYFDISIDIESFLDDFRNSLN